MRNRSNPYMPSQIEARFPFRRDNRKPDGTWAAEDATENNIKGTSVDFYDPVWPRWKRTPPQDGEGEFISDQPFFDIDEITQTATFYPPGTPLVDWNVDGNPARRQRVNDTEAGNLWRRRLLVGRLDEGADVASHYGSQQPKHVDSFMNSIRMPPVAQAPGWSIGGVHQGHPTRFAGTPNGPLGLPNQAAQSKGITPSGAGRPIFGSMSGTTAFYDFVDGSREVSGGTRTWRTNNPGAIEYGNFAKSHGAIGTDGRFAIFPDEATGTAALDALLRTPGYQRRTIEETIAAYATT